MATLKLNKLSSIMFSCAILLILSTSGCSGNSSIPSAAHPNSPTAVMAVITDSKGSIYAGTTGNGTAIPNGSVYVTAKPIDRVTNEFNSSNVSWSAISGHIPNGSMVVSMAIDSNDNIYAATSSQGANGGSVYVLKKGSPNWALVGGGAAPDHGVIRSISLNAGNIYAGSTGPSGLGSGHVYVSTNATSAWSAIGNGVNFPAATLVHAITVGQNGAIYAAVNSAANGATAGGYIYVVTTPSSSWHSAVGNGPMPNGQHALAVTVDTNNNVYAGTGSNHYKRGGSVFVSTNGTSPWSQIAKPMPDGGSINQIIVKNKNIYVASGGGNVYLATLGSSDWTMIGGSPVPGSSPVYTITLTPATGDVYAGTRSGMVFLAKNGTEKWVAIGGGRVPLNP